MSPSKMRIFPPGRTFLNASAQLGASPRPVHDRLTTSWPGSPLSPVPGGPPKRPNMEATSHPPAPSTSRPTATPAPMIQTRLLLGAALAGSFLALGGLRGGAFFLSDLGAVSALAFRTVSATSLSQLTSSSSVSTSGARAVAGAGAGGWGGAVATLPLGAAAGRTAVFAALTLADGPGAGGGGGVGAGLYVGWVGADDADWGPDGGPLGLELGGGGVTCQVRCGEGEGGVLVTPRDVVLASPSDVGPAAAGLSLGISASGGGPIGACVNGSRASATA